MKVLEVDLLYISFSVTYILFYCWINITQGHSFMSVLFTVREDMLIKPSVLWQVANQKNVGFMVVELEKKWIEWLH